MTAADLLATLRSRPRWWTSRQLAALCSDYDPDEQLAELVAAGLVVEINTTTSGRQWKAAVNVPVQSDGGNVPTPENDIQGKTSIAMGSGEGGPLPGGQKGT